SAPWKRRRLLRRVGGAGKRGARLIFDHGGVSGHIELETGPRVQTRKRPAMTGDLRQQPRTAGRIAFLKLAVIAAIARAALMSAGSKPSDSQQTAAQQQQQAADEQARKEADEKAWADAEKTGTVAAYTAYLQNFGAGAHVSEASQRIVALNEQARKAADEK